MPIDETLARYSDFSFKTAIVVYALALTLLFWQYATARGHRVVERELASVGGGAAPQGPGRIIEPQRRSLSERVGNMAFSVLVVAVALHVVAIVLRGFSTHRFPLGNMYEFITMATAAAVLTGLLFLREQRHRSVWAFLLVPVLILLFLAGTVLHSEAAPVVPALQSYWLPVHVTIVSVGSGVFLFAGVASILFLYRLRRQPDGAESNNVFGSIARRLPDARTLDRLAYTATVIGFPLFGAGVILGAIWAEAAWGRYWAWDPKETGSFITWVLYAAYLHARATSGWRATRAAWINIAAFAANLFNLFFINMVVNGLHSYAGLN
ncbi:c-type cytochrome biogenesis protein CcsB [Nocardia sp. CNY236]|uniref:c-type cytochrome biogenesis protein CcsB n=1 Tax=Nocardia sp. CNY236 TaxID=1169152 RepID=UPI00041EF94C|nr:c-type cytochrome biogenesis protein CcsB [Nocardia sp. CNY236]